MGGGGGGGSDYKESTDRTFSLKTGHFSYWEKCLGPDEANEQIDQKVFFLEDPTWTLYLDYECPHLLSPFLYTWLQKKIAGKKKIIQMKNW